MWRLNLKNKLSLSVDMKLLCRLGIADKFWLCVCDNELVTLSLISRLIKAARDPQSVGVLQIMTIELRFGEWKNEPQCMRMEVQLQRKVLKAVQQHCLVLISSDT